MYVLKFHITEGTHGSWKSSDCLPKPGTNRLFYGCSASFHCYLVISYSTLLFGVRNFPKMSKEEPFYKCGIVICMQILVTWTLGRLNWLMVAGSAAAARITGTNGSQDICHPDTAWITGGGREEMSTGGAEPTLHSPEVVGTIHSHGGASALTCHSWGWALTRWTGIIPAASYNSETEEAVRAVDTGRKQIRYRTFIRTPAW